MKNATNLFFGLLVSAVLTFAPGASALAQNGGLIAQAKNDCLIGEGADGYLHVRGQVPADLDREVKAVNLKRKAAYSDLAKENNVAVDIAAALTAEKLVAKAMPGQCVVDVSGKWTEIP